MELFDYQKEAIQFVGVNKKVYLAMDMGTGKTLTALSAAAQLSKKHVLVIAEKNEVVNSENFKKEVINHFPEFQYMNLRDSDLSEVAGSNTRTVCAINPDGLKKHSIEKLREIFDFVIIDEATMAKTTTTARFKLVRKVCREMEYVVLLSGTPMMNGAAELYAPLLLLDHPLAGDGTAVSREAYESIFAGGHRRKIRNTGVYWQDFAWWAKGANHVRELRYIIRDRFFFYSKQGSKIFKTKTRRMEKLPMSLEWLSEYTQAWDKYLEDAGKRDVDMDNVLELQRLIENGQLYQVNSKWKARRAVADIALGKYGNQRIVLFTMFVESFELMQTLLEEARVSYKTFDVLHEYKAGSEQVLLGRIKAHGKGGNVSEANIVLMVDMDFVPANNLQAENRVDRPEQTRDMEIIYYMTEGDDVIDEHVRHINQDKTRKIDEFMRPLDEAEIADLPVRVHALHEQFYKHFNKLGYDRSKLIA